MKGKRILWGILIAAILLFTVVLAVAANNDGGEADPNPTYSGEVSYAEVLINRIDSKVTVREKIKAFDKLVEYISTIDPASEGYDDMISVFEAKKLEIAKIILADAQKDNAPEEREASLLLLKEYLASHTVSDEAGSYLYIASGSDKLYVNLAVNGTDAAVVLGSEPTTLYRFDETAKTVVATVGGVDYCFTALSGDTLTVAPGKLADATVIGQLYYRLVSSLTEEETEAPDEPAAPTVEWVAVDAPESGVAYKLGFAADGKLYFLTSDGAALGATENVDEAADLFLEKKLDLFTAIEECTTDIAMDYFALASKSGLSETEIHAALDAFEAYRALYNPVMSDSFTAELSALNLSCAQGYLSNAKAADKSTDRGALLRVISLFIKEHDASSADGYDDFFGEFSSLKTAYSLEMLDAASELHKKNHYPDLDKSPLAKHDFTPDDKVTNPNNKVGVVSPVGNTSNNQTVSFIGNDIGMDGDNGYFTVKYEVKSTLMGAQVTVNNISTAAVFEFDITTFGTLPIGKATELIKVYSTFTSNGTNWDVNYLSITSEGDIIKGAETNVNNRDVLVKNAVTKGEWTHICVVVDYETNIADLYVDYVLVGSVSTVHSSKGYVSTPPQFRVAATPSVAGGEFSLDNVKVYQGHAPRDLDFVTNTTAEDAFIFYVNQVQNTEISNYARKVYYDNALRFIDNYYDDANGQYVTGNAAVNAAVDKLLGYSIAPDENTLSTYQAILKGLSDDKIEALEKAVNKVVGLSRNESNAAERTYFLTLAEELLASSSTYIQDSAALAHFINSLNTVSNNLTEEVLLNDFVNIITNFKVSTSVESMRAYYNEAAALYKSVDKSLATPAFQKFMDAINYFENEMSEDLVDKVLIENSKRLLACITYVSLFDESEWDAKFDEIITYVLMARDIIESGEYDPNYKNGGELVEGFIPVCDYFIAKRQERYLDHVKSELERAKDSDKYFEKLGVCIKLEEYVIENELEGGNEELDGLIAELRALHEELKGSRDEYEQLLQENKTKFVDICKDLVGSIDYVTMKRICDAASEYYYMMDVSDASTQDAISIYVARCNEINAVEAYAQAFILEVATIYSPSSDTLAAIVAASKYLDDLNVNVEGVADALVRFKEACANYDSAYADANGEISTTFNYAMASVNSYALTASIITLAYGIIK